MYYMYILYVYVCIVYFITDSARETVWEPGFRNTVSFISLSCFHVVAFTLFLLSRFLAFFISVSLFFLPSFNISYVSKCIKQSKTLLPHISFPSESFIHVVTYQSSDMTWIKNSERCSRKPPFSLLPSPAPPCLSFTGLFAHHRFTVT